MASSWASPWCGSRSAIARSSSVLPLRDSPARQTYSPGVDRQVDGRRTRRRRSPSRRQTHSPASIAKSTADALAGVDRPVDGPDMPGAQSVELQPGQHPGSSRFIGDDAARPRTPTLQPVAPGPARATITATSTPADLPPTEEWPSHEPPAPAQRLPPAAGSRVAPRAQAPARKLARHRRQTPARDLATLGGAPGMLARRVTLVSSGVRILS